METLGETDKERHSQKEQNTVRGTVAKTLRETETRKKNFANK